MKILKAFVLFGLVLFSCVEKEEPHTIYGDYFAQSITTDRAIDISGDGVATADLLNNFLSTNGGFLSNNSSNIIFLRLYSPEYFNTGFPQVLFNLPYQLQNENRIAVEYHLDGRRYSLTDDGTLGLQWNSPEVPFDTPDQIMENIFIESLKSEETQKTLELVVSQRLFDFTSNDWVDVKITYSLIKDH